MIHKLKELYLLQISDVGLKYKYKGFLFAGYFNDGSNLALSHYLKQFPLQKNEAALKRFVKKYINKNNQALGKCKKVFNILGQNYEKYVVHHMQTVPHGDRLHFSQVFKIYYKNKKLNIDLIKTS